MTTAPSEPAVDDERAEALSADDQTACFTDEQDRGRRAPGRRAPAGDACGLAFDAPGGPIVAVCGLHGGAGTSTLAHLLAATAAVESSAAVLLCESDDVAGDIARLTGTASPLSLGALAAAYAAGAPPTGGTLARADQLRVIAAAPASPATTPDGAIAELIRAASARHGLTVLDVGTLRARGARELLRLATHVIWITLAQPGAGSAARALLASDLVPALTARQILVVRTAHSGRRSTVREEARELREVAEQHCDRVITITHDPAAPVDATERRTQALLSALAGALQPSRTQR